MIWYLWQIRTAVKYIQILRQRTTHRGKNTKFCFATTRKSNKKHTRFLKKHFFFFFNPSFHNIWRHLSSFCVCVSKSFRLFWFFFFFLVFFCWRISYLKQASRALVNVTDMFFFLFWFLQSGADWLVKHTFAFLHLDVHFCLYFALFRSLSLSFFLN